MNKFLVSRNCFFPKPKITSIVIHFKPKRQKYNIKKISNLEMVTNKIFSNKRKMVNKNLRKIFKNELVYKNLKFNLNLRPQEINEENYYKITELLEKR